MKQVYETLQKLQGHNSLLWNMLCIVKIYLCSIIMCLTELLC